MVKDILKGKELILASGSPRRQELLRGMGFDFSIRLKDCDESVDPGIPIEEHAIFLARKKASVYKDELRENEVIITADTTVLIGDEVLNKPANADEARSMLRKLSDKEHKVITGVNILAFDKEESFSDLATVQFEQLGEDEIDYYIDHYRPFDKAGAYGIQEWLGLMAIKKIVGSYYTIMGLPTHLVYRSLKEF